MKDYKKLQNGSDIRGIAMEGVEGEAVNLTLDAVKDLAGAFGLWLCEKTGKTCAQLKIAAGRDSRLSGPAIMDAFMTALADMGVQVLDCGMASTPAMFMATVFEELGADGSVMITASHLPFNRNGIKFFTREGGLGKNDIKALVKLAEEGLFEKACGGSVSCADLMSLYCAHLRKTICEGLGKAEADKPLSGLQVAVDAGNGAGGFYVSKVLEPLGADCTGSRFLEPDGTFPNHQPNPENKEAMKAVCQAVKDSHADLGIIFDTDVDRASAVDSTGKAIDRNAIVALSAILAADGHPGAVIVTDSITSTQLHTFLVDMGMEHLRFKRGYKNVIDKGLELNAEGKDCVLAIETSGHAAMRENFFLDDGAYLATRIVVKAAQLKAEGKGIESCIKTLGEPAEAAEFRLPLLLEDFGPYAQNVIDSLTAQVAEGKAPGMTLELPNYEGVRITCDETCGNGWLLIRKSLHDPLMPLNIESNEAGGLEKIKAAITAMLEPFDQLDISKLKA